MDANISKFITERYVPELVKHRRILAEDDRNDYVIKSCTVLPVTSDGTFMLSICNRVKVDLQKVGDDEKDILHLDLVIKLTPPGIPKENYDLMGFARLFTNEILVYTKICPQLTALGFYPKYYYGHVGEEDCSLVLGDFGVTGWRMAPTLVNLSLEHILLTVKLLGKFHGSCYAMKESSNDEFQSIVRQLSKTRFEQDSTGSPIFDAVTQRAPKRGIEAARRSGSNRMSEEELKQLEEGLFSEAAKLCKELVQPVEPLAIICHGDFLRNNIAFKYENPNDLEHPIDVTMFDFQTMSYTSPMMDLVTFMANSTGRDVRGPHFETIFRAYHTELINVLCDKLGTSEADLPGQYSYDNFLREYSRMLPFGYCVASTFIAILHVPLEGNMHEDMLAEDPEPVIQDMLTRGGEVVDRELEALVYDIHELQQRFRCRKGLAKGD